jgi:hypothetical protein
MARSPVLLRLVSLVTITLALLLPALGQGNVVYNAPNQGQPLIYYGVSGGQDQYTTGPAGTLVDAYIYKKSGGSTDLCGKVNDAWTDAMATGAASVTIDARGFPSAQNCLTSPFPSGAQGRLLLGNQQISSNVSWVIPSGVEVVGLGSKLAGTNSGTFLKASTSFSDSSHAIVQIGSAGTNTTDAKLRNLTIDCGGNSSCWYGVLNIAASDNARIEDVTINNAPKVGLVVIVTSTGSAQNSGSYRNITVSYPSCSQCSSNSPIGMELSGNDSGAIIRGVQNIRVSGCSLSSSPAYGIQVVGASTKIENTNVECFPTGIQVGDPSSTSTTTGVQIDNSYFRCATFGVCTGANQTGTAIAVSQGSTNITLTNVNGDSQGSALTNLITYYDSGAHKNAVGGVLYEGFLMLGPKQSISSGGFQSLLSSDPLGVPWITQNQIHSK